MNYPSGIIKDKKEVIKLSHKNRGMNLEHELNDTNNYYIDKGLAYIYKKATPITLVRVNYAKKRIDEGYFEMPSTTDYNGIYKGHYIDFEAKETINLKYFSITNIHSHQIRHIRNILKEQGICFLIIRFTRLHKTYLLLAKDFVDYIDEGNKSIPLSYFEKKGYLIKDKYIPRIDYLEIINELYGGMKDG